MTKAHRPLVGAASSGGWRDCQISLASICDDEIWIFDIERPGIQRDALRFDWTFPPPDDSAIKPLDHLGLKEAAKEFLWSMQVDPPSGRRPNAPATILGKAQLLKTLIRWMASEGLAMFSNLGVSETERFAEWLRRPGRRRVAGPRTLVNYLELLQDLYRQRRKITDAPITNPLGDLSAVEIAGQNVRRRIPHIPDEIALPLLKASIEWVQAYSGPILQASSLYQRARDQRAQRFNLAADLKRSCIKLPDGHRLDGFRAVREAETRLMDACFISIAGFVGMRVSEILALRADPIETDRSSGLTYLKSKHFKGVVVPGGVEDRWLAPSLVVDAIKVLEMLTSPLRQRSGRAELFIVPSSTGCGGAAGVLTAHMNARLNEFGSRVGIRQIADGEWRLSTHQFRKTFGRYVARRDRTQLLGLSIHFKHSAIGITARDYVGTEFDLSELLEKEGRAQTVEALNDMLGADRLAGKMGERLTKLNVGFRGRTGNEVRRNYIDWVLSDTDLVVHACDYGWCVFQSETARCGGLLQPNEALRSPSACLSCANMAVGDRHQPYWEDRRSRNAKLLDDANDLTKAVLNAAIAECDSVLKRIGKAKP